MEGTVFSSRIDGAYLLKFKGDVRLTLCTTLDQYFEKILSSKTIHHFIIDLTEVENIDSTSLGLLAKLGMGAQKYHNDVPTLISTNEDINEIIETMGIDVLFLILDELPQCAMSLHQLPVLEESEGSSRDRIVEAHRLLMDIKDDNVERFEPLVKILKAN